MDADRGGIERGASADEYVGGSGHGPALFPVGEPGGQAVSDRQGERDGAFIQVEAPVVDVGQLQLAQLADRSPWKAPIAVRAARAGSSELSASRSMPEERAWGGGFRGCLFVSGRSG